MRKKVLVLGSTGLIGHQIYNYLDSLQEYEMLNIAYRTKLNEKTILHDIRNEASFLQIIEKMKPDIIINAIGILIDGANKDPGNAIFINAYMPHKLQYLADDIEAKLIHFSTDCVFSGKKGSYIEDDIKDANDTYGRAKALGEITKIPHLTLRTSVVGPELKEGEELFHWFMRQEDGIKGFTKSLWSGVTTLELAKAVEWAIVNDVTGLYHITNGRSINKYDLLELFKKFTHKEIDIEAVDGRVTNKTLIDTRKEIDYPIPDYEVMVRDMITLIKNDQTLYSQYSIG